MIKKKELNENIIQEKENSEENKKIIENEIINKENRQEQEKIWSKKYDTNTIFIYQDF